MNNPDCLWCGYPRRGDGEACGHCAGTFPCCKPGNKENAALRERVAELEEHCKSYDYWLSPDEEEALVAAESAALEEVARLRDWINDLQAGCWINCVYCGHRYGPDDEVPASMADVLKEHIEQCPDHPMSRLRAEVALLRGLLGTMAHYQIYNDVEPGSTMLGAIELDDEDLARRINKAL